MKSTTMGSSADSSAFTALTVDSVSMKKVEASL